MHSLTKKFLAYRWLFSIAFIMVFLDRVSKLLVQQFVPENTYFSPPPIPVIDNALYIVHIYNTGAAWGSFSGGSLWLGLLAIAVIATIFFFRKQLELERPIMQWIGGIFIGGIIGNLFDRLYYGYVIDFIDVHLPGYRWPAFNIADMCITVSVGLYILLTIKECLKKPN